MHQQLQRTHTHQQRQVPAHLVNLDDAADALERLLARRLLPQQPQQLQPPQQPLLVATGQAEGGLGGCAKAG